MKHLKGTLTAVVLAAAAPAYAQDQGAAVDQTAGALTFISIEQATAAVRARMPDGIIVKAELEGDDSNWPWSDAPDITEWVWEIDVVAPDSTEYEVSVNALTGEVLDAKEE